MSEGIIRIKKDIKKPNKIIQILWSDSDLDSIMILKGQPENWKRGKFKADFTLLYRDVKHDSYFVPFINFFFIFCFLKIVRLGIYLKYA